MPRVVVAIPVRDEAALIGDCLRALALQQGQHRAEIVLLVNNSSDGTADLVRALQPTLPGRLHVIEHDFPPSQANAGHARRMAMEHAAMLADAEGILMTTDADSCVAADWLEANLAALRTGADVVCGRAVINPVDALGIPRHLHDDDAVEVAYGTALDRMSALLDPDPADPWPRHTEESGASIAVRRPAFLAAGGVPAVSLGEDRALVGALRGVDARVRHDPDVCVTVSGRTEGRAADGMADTIRRRLVRQDDMLDGAMEPAGERVRRIGARRLLRLAWARPAARARITASLAGQLSLPANQIEGWLALPYFGAAWAKVEASSLALVKRPVARTDVHTQLRAAQDILRQLEASAPSRTGRAEPGLVSPPALDRPPA